MLEGDVGILLTDKTASEKLDVEAESDWPLPSGVDMKLYNSPPASIC